MMNLWFNYTLPLFVLLTIIAIPLYFLSKRLRFRKKTQLRRFNQPIYASRPRRFNLTVMGIYLVIAATLLVTTFYLENWPQSIEPKTTCQDSNICFMDPLGLINTKSEYAMCYDEHSELIFKDPNTAFDAFIQDYRFQLYKVHLKFNRYTPINRHTYRNYADLNTQDENEAPFARFFKIFNQSVYPNIQDRTLSFIPFDVETIDFKETYQKPNGDIERTDNHQEFAIISIKVDLQADDPIIDYRNAFTLISADASSYQTPRIVLNQNREKMETNTRYNQATLIFNVNQETPYDLIFATENSVPQKITIREP